MAKITTLVCDFDGKTQFDPAEGHEDFLFQVGDKRYVIDLSSKGMAAFEAAREEAQRILAEAEQRAADLMAKFVAKARPAPLTDAERAMLARQFYNRVKRDLDERNVKYNERGKLREEYIVQWEQLTGEERPEFMRDK